MTVHTTDINSFVNKLSSFGTYQKRNFLLLSLAVIFSAVQYSYVFSTRSTKHRCYIYECDEDKYPHIEYNQTWLYDAIPSDDTVLRKCERYAPALNSESSEFCSTKWFNKSSVLKCDKLVVDGDYLTTIEQEFKLTCEDNLWKLTALGSLDEIAEVLFAPFVGYFSDKFGRKWVLIYSLILSGVCGVFKSLSPSYIFYATMEFVTACFTSGIYGSGFILGVELLSAEQRVFGSTLIAIAFPFGEITLGLAAWFSPSWRFMLRVLYAPGIFFIAYYWLLDDSVCFLLATGKNKKAYTVVKKIIATNKLDMPLDVNLQGYHDQSQSNFASVSTKLEKPINDKLDANSTKSSANISINIADAEDDNVEQETFMNLFKYPSLIFRVINCSFSWISCTFMYYGLTIFSVSLTGNIYLNFIIMALIELPGYVACYYMLDPFGRRPTLVGSLLLSGVACLVCIFITPDNWILQLIFPIIGKLAATMAFKTIYIYTAEMFPTTLRHTLLAFCSMFGRAGSIAAPQLPIMATVSPFLPPLLFGILGVSAGALAFFLPETTGCKLPDTLKESLVLGRPREVKQERVNKEM